MFSHFFIERPIFASVLSIVITLTGLVAVANLPVAQFPPITPPSIMVMCNYPGANARDVADSVAAPIEQEVNGVEDMLYMVSQSNNDGSYTLTVTFKPGVNLNFAQVLVQNRINLALPLLPDVVKQAGVTTRKRNPDILQVIAVFSPNDRYDQLYLSNFVTIKVKDEIARVDGVGDCQQFGQQDYCMRLWLDPERLSALNMTAGDVANAIREQNLQVASGHFGQQPAPANANFEFTITTLGRLQSSEQFNNIILRADNQGRTVRLKDVGIAKLGAKNLDSTSKVNGKPNGSLAVFPLPEANAIDVARRVRERLEQLKKDFPEDVDYVISLDMTPFMQESINEVIRTLIEAVILVAAVVLLFLQNWRSALIPLVAVPVAIIGTFAVMAAIGFTLNNLTLFGLVLAIGIVVDDAIVVVEAVEHHIEHGLSPRKAAHKAMDQVSGPVVAVALVLSAVFVPCAFITGITGQFFRQFALTIAVSTVISAFNSLTLSPALAALLLKSREENKQMSLPWLAFPLLGGGLGYVLLARGPVLVWGTGVVLGMLAGVVLGPWLWSRLAQREQDPTSTPAPRTILGLPRARLVFAVLGAWLGACYLGPGMAITLKWLAGHLPEQAGEHVLAAVSWVEWWASGLLPGVAAGWFLGPRLAALALQGLSQGIRAPLPRIAFPLIGAGLGFFFLTHLMAPVGSRLAGILPAPASLIVLVQETHPSKIQVVWGQWLAGGTGALVGAIAGLLAAPALNWFLGWFFGVFNLVFRAGTDAYSRLVGLALRASAAVLLVYGALLLLTWWTSTQLPTGYIPNQDQGRFYIAVQLPDAASLERTQEVVDRITNIINANRLAYTEYALWSLRRDGVPDEVMEKLEELQDKEFASEESLKEALAERLSASELQQFERKLLKHAVAPMLGVLHTTGIAGMSFTLNANGSNFAQFFLSFDSFDKRNDPSLVSNAIVDRVRGILEKEVPEAKVSLFTPPPVPGLGSANGFKLIIEDRGDLGLTELQNQTDRIIAAGNGGHFKLTSRSFAALGTEYEPRLSELDALTDRQFAKPKDFDKAVTGVLTKAGLHHKGEQGNILDAIRPIAAVNGSGYRMTPQAVSKLHKLVERSFDFLRPVPEEVLAKLEEFRDKDFVAKELFDSVLAAPLAEGFAQAGINSSAEQMRIKKRLDTDAENRKVVGKLFSIFRANTPQLYVNLDRDQCQTMGVNPTDVFSTLQIYLGSLYINDFNRFGRTWQVVAQARGLFRDDPDKIKLLKVRNSQGGMVPLGAVLKVEERGGPINIGRYNMYPAAAILGATERGVSTGQGIEEMEALCNELLPPGMAFEWTEINYMQIDADKNIWNNLIFPLAVVFVFLVLAAQYESWALPLAVILVVPMCILGSLTGVAVTKGDINIFTQIGFVVLVGLASKNAILIVEFAKHKVEDDGMSRREATLAACQLRLRPILMTSVAFILGVVPLLVGHGAGATMRRVLGIAVFSGMLGVTLFGIFLTPVFFYVIEGFTETPLFSTARMRVVGKWLFYVVGIATLGLPWWVSLLVRRGPAVPARSPARILVRVEHAVPQPEPLTNGAVNGHDGHQPFPADAGRHENGQVEKPDVPEESGWKA